MLKSCSPFITYENKPNVCIYFLSRQILFSFLLLCPINIHLYTVYLDRACLPIVFYPNKRRSTMELQSPLRNSDHWPQPIILVCFEDNVLAPTHLCPRPVYYRPLSTDNLTRFFTGGNLIQNFFFQYKLLYGYYEEQFYQNSSLFTTSTTTLF